MASTFVLINYKPYITYGTCSSNLPSWLSNMRKKDDGNCCSNWFRMSHATGKITNQNKIKDLKIVFFYWKILPCTFPYIDYALLTREGGGAYMRQ